MRGKRRVLHLRYWAKVPGLAENEKAPSKAPFHVFGQRYELVSGVIA